MGFAYNEIKDQFNALKKTSDFIKQNKENLAGLFSGVKQLVMIGCGSSYSVLKSYDILAKLELGVPSSVFAAGDVMLNYERYAPLLKDSLVITISRSGSTSEVVNAINNIKKVANIKVLSIVSTMDSAVAKLSDLALEMPWTFDESVCQTRTVANFYAAGAIMFAQLSGNAKLLAKIDEAIAHGGHFMDKYEADFKAIAQKDFDSVVVLADGEIEGLAEEAALAYKEICQLPSNYYHLLDARHGPMVLFGKKTLVIFALSANDIETQKKMVADVAAKGCTVLVYSAQKLDKLDNVALQVSSDMELCQTSIGLHFLPISHFVSFFKAENLGVDPDNPTGLSAWIKL